MSRDEAFKIIVKHIEVIVEKNGIVKSWEQIEEEHHIFFYLGLDSLDMTELIMDLEASLLINIPDSDYENITKVSELVTLLEKRHHE
jgi:acyl carrier protein